MYTKELKNNCYYFKDNENKKELKFSKRELQDCDVYSYDVLRITKDFDYNFIAFILKELIKTKDLLMVEILFEDKKILDIIKNNNLKICNYNYVIPFKEYSNIKEYDVSNNLNDENKKYFLKNINEIGKLNYKYIAPKEEYLEISDKWFNNEYYQIFTFKKEKDIAGMVDFKIFDYYECNDELYNYSDSICIRALVANNKETMVDILKYMVNKYQKRIIISHLYTENMLKEAIEDMNGILKYVYAINKNI